MMKRYESVSALIRYIAAVLALVAFIFLFGKIFYTDGNVYLRFRDVFFNYNENQNIPHVYGFIAQLFILFGGAFGVLIPIINVFVSEEKKYSFICGGVLIFCGVLIVLLRVLFPAFEGASPDYFGYIHLYGTTIAAACLAVIAGGLNIWAAFIKE